MIGELDNLGRRAATPWAGCNCASPIDQFRSRSWVLWRRFEWNFEFPSALGWRSNLPAKVPTWRSPMHRRLGRMAIFPQSPRRRDGQLGDAHQPTWEIVLWGQRASFRAGPGIPGSFAHEMRWSRPLTDLVPSPASFLVAHKKEPFWSMAPTAHDYFGSIFSEWPDLAKTEPFWSMTPTAHDQNGSVPRDHASA